MLDLPLPPNKPWDLTHSLPYSRAAPSTLYLCLHPIHTGSISSTSYTLDMLLPPHTPWICPFHCGCQFHGIHPGSASSTTYTLVWIFHPINSGSCPFPLDVYPFYLVHPGSAPSTMDVPSTPYTLGLPLPPHTPWISPFHLGSTPSIPYTHYISLHPLPPWIYEYFPPIHPGPAPSIFIHVGSTLFPPKHPESAPVLSCILIFKK